MDLGSLLRVVRRWPGVMLSAMLIAGVATGLQLRAAEPVYEAQLKLQLTAPPDEDVSLYSSYRASYLRDEMTASLNNFIEVLRSREVYNRTIKQLGLNGQDGVYVLKTDQVRDSDFLYISVRARTPTTAANIANTHTTEAIAWFGEIRARPAEATKNFISDQLGSAKKSFEEATAALTDFKIKHKFGKLEDEFAAYQDQIQRLQDERNTRLLDGPKNRGLQSLQQTLDALYVERDRAYAQGSSVKIIDRYDEAIARNAAQFRELQKSANPTAEIDALLQQRRAEFANLLTLEPTYNELSKNVEQAQAEYQLLLSKYTEAVLKENTAKTSSNIQVVEMASAPEKPVSANTTLILAAALFGGLGIGVLLALLLEFITSRSAIHVFKPAQAKAKE